MSSKANNLYILKELGVQVPDFKTFNITEDDLDRFEENFTKFIATFYNPYFDGKFSVRSSGSTSTPGRMKTILKVENIIPNLLEAAVEVFKSTRSSRLKTYLELKDVENFSTAIIVQRMVYPTMDENSCSGVLTTCHPISMEDKEYGEIIFGNFSDSLMSGEVNPLKLELLKERNPTGYSNLMKEVAKIKGHFDKHQEIEFVIDGTDAWILQARNYKQVTPMSINFDGYKMVGIGKPATPRGAVGIITYNLETIKEDSIYVSASTDWEDTKNILKGKGIITLTGGSLSHAAIIAREFELPCITGAELNRDLKEGDKVGMDDKGRIFKIN